MKSIYRNRVEDAISESERFIKRAQEYLEAKDDWISRPKMKRASMKRASMDLTRSLAEIRKPNQ